MGKYTVDVGAFEARDQNRPEELHGCQTPGPDFAALKHIPTTYVMRIDRNDGHSHYPLFDLKLQTCTTWPIVKAFALPTLEPPKEDRGMDNGQTSLHYHASL